MFEIRIHMCRCACDTGMRVCAVTWCLVIASKCLPQSFILLFKTGSLTEPELAHLAKLLAMERKLSLRVTFPKTLASSESIWSPGGAASHAGLARSQAGPAVFSALSLPGSLLISPQLLPEVLGHNILLIALLFYTAPASIPSHNAAPSAPETNVLCRSLAAKHRTL